jgi:ribonuclease J
MQALEETGSGGFNDLIDLSQSFQVRQSKRGDKLTKMKGEESKMSRKRSICKDRFQIKDLTVESIPINHSLPGATAYIIHSSIGPIVYTGDLRFHGTADT